MFLVVAKNKDGVLYFANKENGFRDVIPTWVKNANDATIFPTRPEAMAVLNHERMTERDGIFPPSLLHHAAGVCFKHPKEDIEIVVYELLLNKIFSKSVTVEIDIKNR